ncbi:MAG: hypothetical protein RMJ07_05770 [Nitrososphaerota archaeon]|nr:hypothetical protein [Candidatus Bathyarchaeota archaeon]MDW8049167.1 hypothetical protein [Nitrososphaerota archaeon]
MALIYYCGISLISFKNFYNTVNINPPIFTLWYSPPIQWGIPGAIFLIAMAKCIVLDEVLEPSLAFNLFMCTLLAAFIIILNIVNLYYFIYEPFPFMPIFFLPFFALASAHILGNGDTPERLNRDKKPARHMFIVLAVTILFVGGSLSHSISATYWNISSWWTEESTISSCPTEEEVRILNLLYGLTARMLREEACYIPKNEPFPNSNHTIYQLLAHLVTPIRYLIGLSGITFTFSGLAISGLYHACSIEEIFLIKEQFSRIRFLLVDKETNSLITQLLGEEYLLLKGEKYNLYELPRQSTASPNEGILVEKISFRGNLSIMPENLVLRDTAGELVPLDWGRAEIRLQDGRSIEISSSSLIFEVDITLLNIRATQTYFRETWGLAQRMGFHGNMSMTIIGSFNNTRLYLTKIQLSGTYTVGPEPPVKTSMTNRIRNYLETNDIPICSTLKNPISILWTVLFFLTILLQHIVKRRQKFNKLQNTTLRHAH